MIAKRYRSEHRYTTRFWLLWTAKRSPNQTAHSKSTLAIQVVLRGVLAYSVSRRQQEFGIRVALGSDKTALMRLVMRQAAIPVVGGIFAGVALAFGATRWIGSLFYETKATDPAVIFGSIASLLVAAFLAALLPAQFWQIHCLH